MTELIFKRFSEDKQEQIRQFVAYAQMCGLSGKDIRSIGDKLDRVRRANERKQNMDIVKGFECLPIGDDKRFIGHSLQDTLNRRFKLKTANGTYNFKQDYNCWDIRNLTTGNIARHRVDTYIYELPERTGWEYKMRCAVLLDINSGKLKLNF